MKKLITLTILTILAFGCSNSEDETPLDNTSLIIGTWKLNAQYNSDGTNQNIDECEQKSTITFKTTNTFDANYYRIINGDCILEDIDTNIQYEVDGNNVEITYTYTNNQGQTVVSTNDIRVKFPDNNTLEVYEIKSDGSVYSTPSDVWKRKN